MTPTLTPVSSQPPRLLLSIEEALATLNISRSELYDQMARGQLRYVKIGRRRLVATDDLRDFVDRLRDSQSR